MARISELHYSNAYAASSGVSEFLEVALDPSEDPADFTVSFYQDSGNVGVEIGLDDPGVQVSIDPDNGEVIYIISADFFNIRLTDPDGGGSNNYEAYALTNTDTSTVIDFYDIGGGTQNILALDGLAAGATSDNLPVLVGPNSTTTTLQFNQPDPGTLTHATVGAGDTGLACFAEGTRLDTPDGPRRIERLRPGDMVLTRDDGPQPVRWIGARMVPGTGRFAPICVSKGTLGATEDTYVSPQHRVLVTGWQAELLCGATEVLMPAKGLVNGTTVRRVPRAFVRYVHLMFDRHQIVTSAGVDSESFYPGSTGVRGLDQPVAEELFALFPELRRDAASYGSTARPVGTTAESRLMQVG